MNNLAKINNLMKYITEWYNIIDEKQVSMILKVDEDYSYSLIVTTIVNSVQQDERYYDEGGLVVVPVSYDGKYTGIRPTSYNNIRSIYVDMNTFNDDISVQQILNVLFNEYNIDALEEIIIDNYNDTKVDLNLIIKDNLKLVISSCKPITSITGFLNDEITSVDITLNNSKITSLENLFRDKYKLKYVNLNFDMQYVKSIENMFRSNEDLLNVEGLINLRSLENADYAFYNCRNLLKINQLDCKNVKTAVNIFQYCNAVKKFDGVKDITIDLDISYMDELDKNSISKIIGNLGVCLGEAKTLKMHRYSYNMLSSFDKKYIVNKNWRIISTMINGIKFSSKSVLELSPEELEIMYVSEDGHDVNGNEDAVIPFTLNTFRGVCEQIHNFTGTVFYITSKYRNLTPKYDSNNRISLYDDVNKLYYYVEGGTTGDELYVISDNTGFDLASSEIRWSSHDVTFNLYKDLWTYEQLIDGSFKYIKNSKYDHFEITDNKGRLMQLDLNDLYITNQNFINLFKDCVQLKSLSNLQVVHGALQMSRMFDNCKNLTTINGVINIDNVVSTKDAFKDCISLEDFDGIRKLHCNLDLSSCANLTNKSISNILKEALPNEIGQMKTILLHPDVYDNLSPIIRTQADNKLWILSKDHIINNALQQSNLVSSVIKTNAYIPDLLHINFEMNFALSSIINRGNYISYYVGSTKSLITNELSFIIKIINDGTSEDECKLQIQICDNTIYIKQSIKLYEIQNLIINNSKVIFNGVEYKYTTQNMNGSSLPIYIGSLNVDNSVVGGETFFDSIKVRIIDMIIYDNERIVSYLTPIKNGQQVGLQNIDEIYNSNDSTIYIEDSQIYDQTLVCGEQVNRQQYTNYSYVKNIQFNGTDYIGMYGFYGCTGIEEVVIPQQMFKIDNYAFMKCKNLKSCKIEQTNPILLEIVANAFTDCHPDFAIYVKRSPDHSIIEMFRKYWTHFADIIKEY